MKRRERATATEPAAKPEPIRPIVRLVIVAMPDEACSEYVLAFLDDPFVRSAWGEVVEQ